MSAHPTGAQSRVGRVLHDGTSQIVETTVTFFRLTRDGVFTQIHTLDPVEGDTTTTIPLFVASDGSLLGTLPLSGTNDRGTLFRLTTTGMFNVLHAFTPAEGRAYSGVVRHPNGSFYGTTVAGSLTGHGMIYSVPPDGSRVVRRQPQHQLRGQPRDVEVAWCGCSRSPSPPEWTDDCS